MNEIATQRGSLKWRLPNISEGMYFMSLFTVIETSQDMWAVKSKMIAGAGMLIDFKSVGYSSYKELLDDRENMLVALLEISDKLFDDILELLLKKN